MGKGMEISAAALKFGCLAVAASAAATGLAVAAYRAAGAEPPEAEWFSRVVSSLEAAEAGGKAAVIIRFAVGALAIAPVAEEILFRGLLQGWLSARVRRWRAFLVTALAFAAAHCSVFFFLPLASVSVCFSLAKERAGIFAAILAHLFYNSAAIAIAFTMGR